MKSQDICLRENTTEGAQYRCKIAFTARVDGESVSSRTWFLPVIVKLEGDIPLSTKVEPLETTLETIEEKLNPETAIVDDKGDPLPKIPDSYTIGSRLNLKLTPPAGFNGQVVPTLQNVSQKDVHVGSPNYLTERQGSEGIPLTGPLPDGSYIIAIPLIIITDSLFIETTLKW
eukprot:CAMPEP_0115022008 /NCGR_PEP_ID=MMETSP0216-20121206/31254_1 /TAXON_ID=223996 /ORGANISM="Protocruzia adherens, Strain Boccale" /LENGTH=172 /DNA_ID=CAMNT_0002394529 /DNA_START=132 /DNA_END=647 /DNA_ORIENTATION=-